VNALETKDSTDRPTEQVKTSPPTCCTADEASAWLRDLAALAEQGDPDAQRCLPRAVRHQLATLSVQGPPT